MEGRISKSGTPSEHSEIPHDPLPASREWLLGCFFVVPSEAQIRIVPHFQIGLKRGGG